MLITARIISFLVALFLLTLLMVPVFAAATASQEEMKPSLQNITFGSKASVHLTEISDHIGGRPAGSDKEEETADYIMDIFTENRYDILEQPFNFVDLNKKENYSKNIIAVKEGLSPEEIIVSAHYDSTNDGKGADDNAASVAVLLEVAERIKDFQTPYTIRFVAFGAEETDLAGSRFYVSQINQSSRADIIGLINMDDLIAGDDPYLYGDSGVKIRDHLLRIAEEENFDIKTKPSWVLDNKDGTHCDCTDFYPFQSAGIPFAHFEAANWSIEDRDVFTQVDPHYVEDGLILHTAFDTIETLDSWFPGRIDERLEGFSRVLTVALTEEISDEDSQVESEPSSPEPFLIGDLFKFVIHIMADL